MRYLLMASLLPSKEFSLQFGNLQFGLLVFSTMLIAAAGYVINDYFDTRTDLINKPDDVVVDWMYGKPLEAPGLAFDTYIYSVWWD